MRTFLRLPLACSMAVALVAAGCGDDGGPSLSDDEQGYADALAAAGWDESFDDDGVDCASAVMVQAIGVEGFNEAGVGPDDVDEDFDLTVVWDPAANDEQVDQTIEGLDRCGVLPAMAALNVDPIARQSVAAQERVCIADELDDSGHAEEIVRVLIFGGGSTFDTTGGHLYGPIAEAMRACDVPPLAGG